MTRHEIQPDSPISFQVNVSRLPSKGMPVDIVATEKQRADLAEIHGLLEIRSLKADILVQLWKRNGVRVTGRIVGDIVQACIISASAAPTER